MSQGSYTNDLTVPYMGQQLVDPATIPPDPDGFDPLEYSRGQKLRERRAVRARSLRRRRDTTASLNIDDVAR